MTYAQIDDRFDEHPKHLRAGWDLEHYGLQVCAITYANRHLTDGFVPRSAVARFGLVDSSTKLRRNLRLASKLIADGFWREADGGFEIVGFLDHNPSKEEVLNRRADLHEKRSAAGRIGGIRSAEVRASKEAATAKQVASTVLKQTPTPLLSDPLRSSEEKDPPVAPHGGADAAPEEPVGKKRRGGRVAAPARPLPADFAVSAKIVAMCKQEGLPDPELGLRDMRDWAASKGIARADWEATLRTWMRDPRTLAKFGPWRWREATPPPKPKVDEGPPVAPPPGLLDRITKLAAASTPELLAAGERRAEAMTQPLFAKPPKENAS